MKLAKSASKSSSPQWAIYTIAAIAAIAMLNSWRRDDRTKGSSRLHKGHRAGGIQASECELRSDVSRS